MKQKRWFIILGAVGIIFLLIWFAVLTLVVKNLLRSTPSKDPIVVNLTLCDEDASDLCVVAFGANPLNLMVINFHLPDADYAAFYLKAANRGDVNMYSCEVSKAASTSVYCTGVRTPLGETIDVEVYSTADDELIARGTFLVSVVARSTPITHSEPFIVEAPITQVPHISRYDIPTEGYPSFGPDDAKIVIVEFGDFQCPYCRRFHEQTYQALLDAYPGQIRFIFRNLPLSPTIHPDAMSAAVASLCANDQNTYWHYHDKLFSSEILGEKTYIQYATDLGLNVDQFTACLSSGKHDDFIQKDKAFATGLGIQSTPTFFINGLSIVGAQPLANFQQLIDKELAGEIPQ
jgi:protein-disulfide isomerase